MTKQESTNHPEYESSGLSYIAFSSNGRDFYPQTVTELLEWRDQAAKSAGWEDYRIKLGKGSPAFEAERNAAVKTGKVELLERLKADIGTTPNGDELWKYSGELRGQIDERNETLIKIDTELSKLRSGNE